jgi:hypothetical protein
MAPNERPDTCGFKKANYQPMDGAASIATILALRESLTEHNCRTTRHFAEANGNDTPIDTFKLFL